MVVVVVVVLVMMMVVMMMTTTMTTMTTMLLLLLLLLLMHRHSLKTVPNEGGESLLVGDSTEAWIFHILSDGAQVTCGHLKLNPASELLETIGS